MHCHCGTNNRAPRWTFTSGVARRRKVGGTNLFFQKSEKQSHSGIKAQDKVLLIRGRLIIQCNFYYTIGLCSIRIKIVLKGGCGGPPPENFTVLGTKLGNSRHFYTRQVTISVLPQQDGRWHLCNMHNLIVIRFENYMHVGTQFSY